MNMQIMTACNVFCDLLTYVMHMDWNIKRVKDLT